MVWIGLNLCSLLWIKHRLGEVLELYGEGLAFSKTSLPHHGDTTVAVVIFGGALRDGKASN